MYYFLVPIYNIKPAITKYMWSPMKYKIPPYVFLAISSTSSHVVDFSNLEAGLNFLAL